jgi:dipeptidase
MGCSTLVVGRLASTSGAVMASHSNDGAEGGGFCHAHLSRVLSADWPANATRRVNGHNIPQVAHTYAYHTEGYAIMNEHQVGLAESTCFGRFTASAGFIDIIVLGQLALERANSSRAAVRIMGALAELYGYNDNAESLLVIDPHEAFIFQILPIDAGVGALWVAQRVPDDHVGAVMNGFSVRVVDFADEHAFMHSSNLRDVARRHGLWHEGTPFDFTRIFAKGGVGQQREGPQFYTGRRMWRAYALLAGASFPYNYTDYVMDAPYPATVAAPPGSISLANVSAAMRDYYEGTPFDMTLGMAAGPFGSPDRFGGPVAGDTPVPGGWERTIATHRSIVSFVLEARATLPDPVGGTVWFAPHAAHTATYAPFPAGLDHLPASYANASDWGALDRGVASWANRFVFNVAQLKFNAAIKQVRLARATLDAASLALQSEMDRRYKSAADMELIGAAYRRNADGIVSRWWQLHDEIVQSHGDGRNPSGYPSWWLNSSDVGYRTLASAERPPPAIIPTARAGAETSAYVGAHTAAADGGGGGGGAGTVAALLEAKRCVRSQCRLDAKGHDHTLIQMQSEHVDTQGQAGGQLDDRPPGAFEAACVLRCLDYV